MRMEQENKKSMAVQTLGILIRLLYLSVVVCAFYLVVTVGFDFGYNLFAAPAMSAAPGRPVEITIESGDSVSEVASVLKQEGLIRDELSFCCQTVFYDKQILPGNYTLNTSMSSKEILRQLDAGPSGSSQ